MKFTFALIIFAALIVFGMSRAISADKPTTQIATGSLTPTVEVTKSVIQSETGSNNIFFPISNYGNRITNRNHGKLITVENRNGLPCGASFQGYHLGDDLEVASNEADVDVPVFAIADGIVRKKDDVSGYGGLLVIEHILDGQNYTVNCGHIRLENNSLQVNDHVIAGQKIAILGKGCSKETDNERKHLHFAIHKSNTIDIKGYTDSQEDVLHNWVNPREFLETHGAISQ